jgi:hypothetical protein
MPKLSLPSPEESTLEVEYQGKAFPVDVMEVQKLLWESGDIVSKNGTTDWRPVFLDLFNRKYGITLTPTAAFLLGERAVGILEDLKKKLLPSQDLLDSTEESNSPSES